MHRPGWPHERPRRAAAPVSLAASPPRPPFPYLDEPDLQSGGAPVVALVGGEILPMTGDPAQSVRGNVIYQGDLILGVGDVRVPRGATVVDVHGKYVIPGLIDAHVHLFDERELPLFLAAGVTSVVNMSGSPLTLEWRAEQAEGTLLAPRIWTTGPMIDEDTDVLFDTTVEVGSEADAERVVRAQAAAGYDLIKMHGDLEVGLYDAVLAAARSVHRPVVGHLSERVGLLHAMKEGQATVEHTEELVFGFFNGRLEPRRIPVAVDAMRRGGAPITPTLVSMDRLAHMLTDDIDALAARVADAPMPPLARACWGRSTNLYRRVHPESDAAWFRDSLAFQVQLTHALADGGVPIFAGTDSGWLPFLVHGDALHDELDLLVQAGLSPAAVLAAATREPGEFFGGERGPGVLAARRPADILVLDADPREDVRNVGRVAMVVADGRLLRASALEEVRATARAASREEGPIYREIVAGDADGAVTEAAALGGNLDVASARVLAMRLTQLGDHEEAREALRVGARAHPESWAARRQAARADLAEGRTEEGKVGLETALSLAPSAVRGVLEAELRSLEG